GRERAEPPQIFRQVPRQPVVGADHPVTGNGNDERKRSHARIIRAAARIHHVHHTPSAPSGTMTCSFGPQRAAGRAGGMHLRILCPQLPALPARASPPFEPPGQLATPPPATSTI